MGPPSPHHVPGTSKLLLDRGRERREQGLLKGVGRPGPKPGAH